MNPYQFSEADYDIVEFHNQLHPRIKVEPAYFNNGLSSRADIYGRSVVLSRLLKALDKIPEHYGFLVWDVYRPRVVQAAIFEWMCKEIGQKMPYLSDEEVFLETCKYASLPSVVGEDYCPPHLSGGAIDLTLIDLNTAQKLDMGTPFDECSGRAHLEYFDQKIQLTSDEQLMKYNRHLLRLAMEHVGFTSYQYEWWHYDIGNMFWANSLKQEAIFGALFGNNEWPA